MSSPAAPSIENLDVAEDDLLGAVSALLGSEVADQVCEAFGGRRVYLPRRPIVGTPITELLGGAGHSLVTERFGSGHFDIPMRTATLRHRKILAMTLAGVPVAEMATQLRCTERHVYQVRAALRANGKIPERRR
ncbi:MAG: hypothetical protein K9G59_07715 [Caulobacter sp.]|nr:hypothetical protein [Caulobacter sp.]